jgi:lysophospholipase L1-like esterase
MQALAGLEARGRGVGVLLPGDGMPNGNTIVLYGDSMTQANDGTSGPSDRGFFNWYNALHGGKFNVIYNAGVSGNSTTQMWARFQADVIAKKPRWCCVMGGINDVAADTPAATTIANLLKIYRALHAARIHVIACTVTPSTSLNTEARGTAWTEINQAIRDFAAATPLMHLADVGPCYRDTGQPALAIPLTAYVDALGTHPNSLGAGTLGKKMYDDLQHDGVINAARDYTQLVQAANDASIWVASIYGHPYNALMTGTAGAKNAPATGAVANEWLASIGGAWSKVDYGGETWQQVVITNEAQATLGAYDTTNPVVGDTLWAECKIRTPGDWVNIKGVPLTLTFLNGATVLGRTEGLGYSAGGGSGTACIEPGAATLRTPNMVVPAGCNKLRITLVLYANGTGSGTLQITKMCIRKL